MTKSELHELIDRVRRRHNRRILCVLAVMLAVFFGGFNLAPSPSSSPDAIRSRQLYIYGVVVVYIAIAAIGGMIVFRRAKTDCFKFGVLCPKCGLNLYSRRHLLFGGAGTRETGVCPHCHYQLVDKTPV